MCLSLAWVEQLIIWLIIACAIVAIIRLVIPPLIGFIGIPMVGQAINIILWAILAIIAVVLIFDLLACLIGMAPIGAPFRH